MNQRILLCCWTTCLLRCYMAQHHHQLILPSAPLLSTKRRAREHLSCWTRSWTTSWRTSHQPPAACHHGVDVISCPFQWPNQITPYPNHHNPCSLNSLHKIQLLTHDLHTLEKLTHQHLCMHVMSSCHHVIYCMLHLPLSTVQYP